MDSSYLKNPMNPKNPGSDNFLIVRTDRLGDVVLTLPMARAIKKAIPNARITFLARDYTRPIIERCPDVDEVRVVDEKASLWRLITQFRKIDAAFFPSPRFRLALAGFLARVPNRIGTGYRWYSFLFTDKIFEHRKTAERHEAEYNLRMLASLGIKADESELPSIKLQQPEIESIDKWMVEHLGSANAKFAVIHITSGGSTRSWPVSQFIKLGLSIIEKQGMNIVLTGVAQDANIVNLATASIGVGRAIPFVGHSLLELAALLERATIVVAGSTGPGHLSAALDTPTIGLFPLPLPLSKARWGFRGARVSNLSPLPIAGCPNCQNCTCMERINVESVINAVELMLTGKSTSEL
jgi:ADP-heptose:LPS heptosyltransferase